MEPIELEFDLDTGDCRRAALFVASGKRRSVSAWPLWRQAALVLIAILILTGRRELQWDLLWLSILICFFALPPILQSWKWKRTAGALGPRRITLTQYGIQLETRNMWQKREWTSFTHVDTLRGDIYLYSAIIDAVMIPVKTFTSLTESAQVYDVIRERYEQAKAMKPVEIADETWPPAPMVERDCSPVAPAGPQMDSDQVTFLINKNLRLTTDFDTLRLDTADASTSYRVASLYRVANLAGRVCICSGPVRVCILPPSAFASPAEARAFVKRLADAVLRKRIV